MGTVLVGGAAVLVTISCLVLIVVTCALLWSVRQMAPYGQLRAKISELSAMVDNLEAQVINLRTKKANARSQQARQTATAAPQELGNSEDDPLLGGLSAEERALFM